MLTATTTSSATVSSSFQTLESTMNTDMWGNRISNARSQGNSANAGPVHGSGTSLSAYGSDESIPSSQQGQHHLSYQGHMNSSHRQPWSIEINDSQQHQNEVNRALSAEELYEYEAQRRRAASVGAAPEPLSSNYLSNGSLSLSAQMAYDQRSRLNDVAQSNSPYRPGQSASVQHSFNRHSSTGKSHTRRESEDGLTEMTSALLTMMDHHDSFEEMKTPVSHNLSPQPERMLSLAPQSVMSMSAYQTKGHYSQSEPNIYGSSTPARPRPPPGMTSLAQAAYQGGSFEDHRSHQNHSTSRPPLGGNYIQPSITPSWGENAPRF